MLDEVSAASVALLPAAERVQSCWEWQQQLQQLVGYSGD